MTPCPIRKHVAKFCVMTSGPRQVVSRVQRSLLYSSKSVARAVRAEFSCFCCSALPPPRTKALRARRGPPSGTCLQPVPVGMRGCARGVGQIPVYSKRALRACVFELFVKALRARRGPGSCARGVGQVYSVTKCAAPARGGPHLFCYQKALRARDWPS